MEKRSKIKYNFEEALKIIFEPSLDFDLKDLSDSDSEDKIPDEDEDEDVILDEIADDIEETDDENDETMTVQETSKIPINQPELPTQKFLLQIPSSEPGPNKSQRTTRSQIDTNICSSSNKRVNEVPSPDIDSEYLSDFEDEIIIEENMQKHKCRWRHVKHQILGILVQNSVYHQRILILCYHMTYFQHFGQMK